MPAKNDAQRESVYCCVSPSLDTNKQASGASLHKLSPLGMHQGRSLQLGRLRSCSAGGKEDPIHNSRYSPSPPSRRRHLFDRRLPAAETKSFSQSQLPTTDADSTGLTPCMTQLRSEAVRGREEDPMVNPCSPRSRASMGHFFQLPTTDSDSSGSGPSSGLSLGTLSPSPSSATAPGDSAVVTPGTKTPQTFEFVKRAPPLAPLDSWLCIASSASLTHSLCRQVQLQPAGSEFRSAPENILSMPLPELKSAAESIFIMPHSERKATSENILSMPDPRAGTPRRASRPRLASLATPPTPKCMPTPPPAATKPAAAANAQDCLPLDSSAVDTIRTRHRRWVSTNKHASSVKAGKLLGIVNLQLCGRRMRSNSQNAQHTQQPTKRLGRRSRCDGVIDDDDDDDEIRHATK